MIMSDSTLARICMRCGIERKHLVLIVLFLRAHPDMSILRGIWDFVRGHGPAAVAAGRAGVRSLPHSGLPAAWAESLEARRQSAVVVTRPAAASMAASTAA